MEKVKTMLCQLMFRNYRSFRDETEFSMQATKMREYCDQRFFAVISF